jgi:regulator of CtrA degradation
MRLTTRLLELASWLMIRRALKEGEISTEEARAKRERVKLRGPGRTAHVKGFAELPLGLRQLIDASYALSDRIFQLDRAIEVVLGQALATDNPVGAQVTRLEEAFSKPPRRLAGR